MRSSLRGRLAAGRLRRIRRRRLHWLDGESRTGILDALDDQSFAALQAFIDGPVLADLRTGLDAPRLDLVLVVQEQHELSVAVLLHGSERNNWSSPGLSAADNDGG